MSYDHIDDEMIKQIINLYQELRREDVPCLLYENDKETTCEILENLLQMHKELDEEMEREADEFEED